MNVGDQAPNFTLRDHEGREVAISDLPGELIVVYFYPKDDTPGCTLEAQKFTAYLPEFEKLKVDVVGISGGDDKSKAKFCKKHNLDVTLLSDTDFSVAKSFGAYGEKTFMGRKYQGVLRHTFLLDKSLKVVKIFESVTPGTHVEELLHFIKTGEEIHMENTETTTKPARKARKGGAKKAGARKGTASRKGAASRKGGARKGAARKGAARKGAARKGAASRKGGATRKGAARKGGATRKGATRKGGASRKGGARKGGARKGAARKGGARRTAA